MASTVEIAAAPVRRGRWLAAVRAALLTPKAAAAVVLALTAWSLVLRTRAIGGSYWIDEGIAVGIASHPLAQIPGLLQQDGSPPLYYVLLHNWMALFGTQESATHALSLVFALLCVPAAWWAGASLFGPAAGLIAAVIAAFDPFLSVYADETRMYALVVLLGIVAGAAFLHAFAFRRRRYVPVFGVALALLLYTHGWALFFAAGAAGAAALLVVLGPDRRRLLVDGAVVVAIVGVLFAPWIPTFLFQAAHTGAPWSLGSTWRAAYSIPFALFGPWLVSIPLLGGAAVGLVMARRERPPAAEVRALVAGVALVAIVIVTAYLGAKVASGWAARYFSMFLGPLIVVLGAALARARWIGLAALVVVSAQWAIPHTPARDIKSNVRPVAARVAPILRHGDLVLTSHPEQVPVLHYYLPPGLRFGTPLGPVRDPRVMDWRDALSRLRAAPPRAMLERQLATVPPGAHVVLVRPKLSKRGWTAPWLHLVSRRTLQWLDLLKADPRFRLLRKVPRHGWGHPAMVRVRALVFVRTRGA
jgi:hypothetical protein